MDDEVDSVCLYSTQGESQFTHYLNKKNLETCVGCDGNLKNCSNRSYVPRSQKRKILYDKLLLFSKYGLL